MPDNYIYHHGVLGMKWGVRKDGKSSSSRKRSAKSSSKRTSAKNKQTSSNDLSSLSDEELQRRIRRLQLERQLKELTADDVSSGKRWAQGMFASATNQVVSTASVDIGRSIARAIINGVVYAGKTVYNKSFDVGGLGNTMANGAMNKR